MQRFLATLKFTEQGIQHIKDTCRRTDAFKEAARQMGARVRDIYWTLGAFDGIAVIDAPDEETATAVMLYVGSKGNVQTQTTRAYSAGEMHEILSKLPE